MRRQAPPFAPKGRGSCAAYGRLVISGPFHCRGMFSGRVAAFLEMACELFFSVRAPLSDGAHLVCGQVLAAPLMSGTLCRPGPDGVRAGFVVFAHERIVAHDLPGYKAQNGNVAGSGRTTEEGPPAQPATCWLFGACLRGPAPEQGGDGVLPGPVSLSALGTGVIQMHGGPMMRIRPMLPGLPADTGVCQCRPSPTRTDGLVPAAHTEGGSGAPGPCGRAGISGFWQLLGTASTK
ncbi:hypothetical protein ABIB51_003896 [Arthrobacter sp. UYCu712]